MNTTTLAPAVVRQKIVEGKMLPLFTSTDLEVSKNVLRASYDAGLRAFEFTNRSENALTVFTALRKFCTDSLPGMLLGIGTIKTEEQAYQFLEAGADFLISPLIAEEIYAVAHNQNILWIPGCATASEIGTAERWGLSLVKIFPAVQLGGPSFIKAVKAVFPAVQLMATGGVVPAKEDLEQWFRSGAAAVGIGAQLFPADLLRANDYDKLYAHVKNITEAVTGASAR